jgi:recombination protein RecA
VVKNRLGPPLRVAEFMLYFDRGISDYDSWLTVMKEHKLVNTTGAWYTFKDSETGEDIKFLSKDFHNMMENNSKLKQKIYSLICDKTILKYQTHKLGIDDVIETDDVVDEL